MVGPPYAKKAGGGFLFFLYSARPVDLWVTQDNFDTKGR
jgi:hypothetical protein